MIAVRNYLICVIAALTLAACDLIRFPGDGGPPPETPEAGPDLPNGAPGPPPPADPVTDPYGTGDANSPDTIKDEDNNPPETTIIDGDETEPPADTSSPDSQETETSTSDAGSDETDSEINSENGTDANTDTDEEPADTVEAQTPAPDPVFSYNAPGQLLPGSGRGDTDQIVHAPDIVFPIKEAPTYLQSMVFTHGGGVAGGDQCDARNYAYPWRDNFCETRTSNRNSPFCPSSRIHQGQDIRVGTAEDCNTLRRTDADDRALHEVVAVEDGVISNVGTYSVNLRAGGHIYKYMHMNMKKLEVTAGQSVTAGQTLGYVSNDFGGTPTTFHLHFEIVENTAENGWAHVPPYLSLVEAYERRENGPGEEIEANVAVASTPFVIPEGFEIIE